MCGGEGIHGLPTIAWDDVYDDDNSNDAVGYTFIKDGRNMPWVEKGKVCGLIFLVSSGYFGSDLIVESRTHFTN